MERRPEEEPSSIRTAHGGGLVNGIVPAIDEQDPDNKVFVRGHSLDHDVGCLDQVVGPV
jgi:hypothetical protein